MNQFQKSQAEKILSCYENIDLQKSQSGEGSRGGKIVGHTKSGHPIYEEKLRTTQGNGPKKSGKNAKDIFNHFSHPAHKDFDYEDHDIASEAHQSKMWQRESEIMPKKRIPKKSPEYKKTLEDDHIYAYHAEQKELHGQKSDELYEVSPAKKQHEKQEAKMAENSVKAEAAEKERKKADREKLKSLPAEDKRKIVSLKNRLESLRFHHSQDSLSFGESVGELRQKIRAQIQKIQNNHLKS